MSRYLRSGILWFWLLVATAFGCVAVLAINADGTETARSRNHPLVRELFDDAVDLRHTLATTIRSGDTDGLTRHVDTLTARWDPSGAPDHHDSRAAAVATLQRLGSAASSTDRDADWRDSMAIEADLFAALAADPADTALIELAATGHSSGPTTRAEPFTKPEFATAEERLAQVIAGSGTTTLSELRSRLAAAGAPTLTPPTTPTLTPPDPQDLPR